jgi:hypothetical protein
MAMDSGALASSRHGRVVLLGEDVVLVVQGERSGVAVRDVGHLGRCIAVDDSEDGAGVVQGSHEGVDAVPVARGDEFGGPPAGEPPDRYRDPGRDSAVGAM